MRSGKHLKTNLPVPKPYKKKLARMKKVASFFWPPCRYKSWKYIEFLTFLTLEATKGN